MVATGQSSPPQSIERRRRSASQVVHHRGRLLNRRGCAESTFQNGAGCFCRMHYVCLQKNRFSTVKQLPFTLHKIRRVVSSQAANYGRYKRMDMSVLAKKYDPTAKLSNHTEH
ncbi:hypothetical protein niasHS_016309 [Heterodera schachtii]|uniref:Uncharacterized protein n=2 Tax=Heterodera TaxID=34509 RepID=A0ABD2HVA4_HETSC